MTTAVDIAEAARALQKALADEGAADWPAGSVQRFYVGPFERETDGEHGRLAGRRIGRGAIVILADAVHRKHTRVSFSGFRVSQEWVAVDEARRSPAADAAKRLIDLYVAAEKPVRRQAMEALRSAEGLWLRMTPDSIEITI